MDYETLKEMVTVDGKDWAGRVFENEDKEIVIVSEGEDEDDKSMITQTYQKNGWTRTNIYHEDGTVEELYNKE